MKSIKPQTREHFDICRCWEFSAVWVALTKSDLWTATRSNSHGWNSRIPARRLFLENAPSFP
jgi:hypothetical protein